MASAAAFDLAAPGYDSGFGRNAAGRVFRYAFQECLLKRFRPGARLLDLGCGTGEDAVFLASAGYSVVGIDSSPRMIEAARAKAERAGLASAALRFEVARAEDAAGRFDGAYSNFGALNCCDLGAVGCALAGALSPGSPVVISVMAEESLPRWVRGLWKGGSKTSRGAGVRRVAGVAVPIATPSPGDVRSALGPEFDWQRGFALGVLLPGPEFGNWPSRHPQLFGWLAIAERGIRGWPLLRNWGDHNVLLGARR